MAKRTKEEAERTRQDLMDAALALFGENGYTATTLADITRRAGVTKGAFYWHFKSKVDVFMSLVDRLQAPLDEVHDQALYTPGTPAERLQRTYTEVLKAFHANERIRMIFEIIFLKVEHSPQAAAIAEREHQAVEEHIAEIVPVVREAIECGEFRADLDPQHAARAMLAYVTGLARHWMADPERFSLKDEAPEFIDMFMNGLRS